MDRLSDSKASPGINTENYRNMPLLSLILRLCSSHPLRFATSSVFACGLLFVVISNQVQGQLQHPFRNIVVQEDDDEEKLERALGIFEAAGGATQWVSRKENHLMIRRFNVKERRIPLSKLDVLPQVKMLTLHGFDFNDDDFKVISNWKHLEGLQLINNHDVTDAGMKSIEKMEKLTWLILWDNKVTDVGMKTIAKMPALEHLEIDDCKITDTGLIALTEAKKLKVIKLSQTKVTNAGEEQFKRANPNCELEVSSHNRTWNKGLK